MKEIMYILAIVCSFIMVGASLSLGFANNDSIAMVCGSIFFGILCWLVFGVKI